MNTPERFESVARNMAQWTHANAQYYDGAAPDTWMQREIGWGIWRVPESDLQVLPPVIGLDVVEVGCGTAYFSAWLARRGAHPVGVDPTPAQLGTARRMQRETGIDFPLVRAAGEWVPLADATFDLVLSEYGASLWAEPERWIREAARLLRPGGRLVFLSSSTLAYLCMPVTGPAGERLVRPQFGIYSAEWPDVEGIEYHLTHGDWIRLLVRHGFQVEDLIEVQAPEAAEDEEFITHAWARQWPCEEIWKARRR